MSALQVTASKTALLLQCPRPFAKDTEIESSEAGEAAIYGQRFHSNMAILLRHTLNGGNVGLDYLVQLQPADILDEVSAHVLRAHNELQAWMMPAGNPWGLPFKVVEVETSRALDLSVSYGGRRPAVLTDPDGAHCYEDLQVYEMGGTADVILEAETSTGIFRVVLDHKTGEHEEFYIHPAKNEQMQALAEMWEADAVAILHTPRGSAPVVYAEPVETSRFRQDLWRANRMVDSGFLRTGSECRYCPARGSCPAKQGELIASTSALVKRTLGAGAMTNGKGSHVTVDPGSFHMMLSELDKLQKMARGMLREEVREGQIIERPDGKVLELVTKNVERLSKKSILEAYGKTRGEEVLQKLRDDGALTEVPQEELRAK